jgi:hypothetical protein
LARDATDFKVIDELKVDSLLILLELKALAAEKQNPN